MYIHVIMNFIHVGAYLKVGRQGDSRHNASSVKDTPFKIQNYVKHPFIIYVVKVRFPFMIF